MFANDEKNNPTPLVKTAFLYFFCCLIVFACYLPLLLRLHYSSDSYHLLNDQHVLWYLQIGRYTFWAIAAFFDSLGINLVFNQRPFLMICLLILAMSIVLFVKLFSKLSRRDDVIFELFTTIFISLIWCNVFMEDWLLFPEAAGMVASGVLLLTVSVFTLVIFDFSLRSAVLSGVFLFFALGSYQAMVGIYISAALMLLYAKYLRTGVFETKAAFRVLFISVLVSIFNVAVLKLLIFAGVFGESGRGASFSFSLIISNLISVIKFQVPFWTSADGLLPVPLMLLIDLIIVSCTAVMFFKSPQDGMIGLFLLVFTVMASYAPHYVESSITLSPRSNISVWASIGFYVAAVLSVDIPNDITCFKKQYFYIPAIAFCAAILASFVFIWDISYDVFTSNVQDRNLASAISVKIKNYSRDTGTTISKLLIVPDSSPTSAYPETRYHNMQLGTKIINVSYANIELVNYIGGLNLVENLVPNEAVVNIIKTSDWDQLDLDDQLFFDGDCAYLALY